LPTESTLACSFDEGGWHGSGRGRGHLQAIAFKDARKAYAADLERWRSMIEKLADLFLRMTTDKAEVAATVHFAATSLSYAEHKRPQEKEVLAEVMKWKQRRRPPLDERDVAQTIRHLGMLGWLDVTPSLDLPVSEEAIVGV
jgi:hypothetical protein